MLNRQIVGKIWPSRSKLSSLWNVVNIVVNMEWGVHHAGDTNEHHTPLRGWDLFQGNYVSGQVTCSSGPSAISQKRATTSDQNAANISCGSTQHICLDFFLGMMVMFSLHCKESMNDLKAKASRACHVSCFWLDDLRISVLTDAMDTLNVRHARAGSEKDEARSQSGAGSLWILWTV